MAPEKRCDTTGQGVFRLSMAHLLGALVLLLVTAPFVMDLPAGPFIESGLLTLVLLTAVLAVGGRRRTLFAAVAFVAPAIAAGWLWHMRPDLIARELSLLAAIAFVVFVILHLLRFILLTPRVTSETLCAAVGTYLMIGLLWSFAYTLVGLINPGAFRFAGNPDAGRFMHGFESLYFSFTTLSTVGYGDIIPVANGARMLAMLEAMSGMFYVAVLIARLVALQTTAPPAEFSPSSRTPETPPMQPGRSE
jgi:hypothetical protein